VLSLRRTVSIPRYLLLVSVCNAFRSGSSFERQKSKRTASRAPQHQLNFRAAKFTSTNINALDRVQNMATIFAHHRNDLNWESLTQSRQISRIYALFKAYTGERAWKAIGDRLQRPCYLSRVDHDKKIRSRKQNKDIGNYSFVNKTIQLWN
jgi:hypothetical protein